jgi:hypothetical protein
MSRLMSLLLIPLCLLGQPMPHAHHGSDVSTPKGHDTRPHVHIGGGHSHSHEKGHHHGVAAGHHHDDEGRAQTAVSSLADHENDALYFSDFPADGSLKRGQLPTDSIPLLVVWELIWPSVQDEWPCWLVMHPPDLFGGLPVYLRTASLRI